jgi:hypothetical protein
MLKAYKYASYKSHEKETGRKEDGTYEINQLFIHGLFMQTLQNKARYGRLMCTPVLSLNAYIQKWFALCNDWHLNCNSTDYANINIIKFTLWCKYCQFRICGLRKCLRQTQLRDAKHFYVFYIVVFTFMLYFSCQSQTRRNVRLKSTLKQQCETYKLAKQVCKKLFHYLSTGKKKPNCTW